MTAYSPARKRGQAQHTYGALERDDRSRPVQSRAARSIGVNTDLIAKTKPVVVVI